MTEDREKSDAAPAPADTESTLTHPQRGVSAPPSLSSRRFIPGMILAGRYRIVAPLGSGGVADVYRAEDMRLGQAVALKFVSRRVTDNQAMLDRILAEVRIGRQLSHPNLCRIYDIAETDSQYFITMEYVDGENLASLLRRVGRLPEDRALEVARELCAGLAAAHDRGVIHRDLKPANVMIDGRGHARITDYGLAFVAGQSTAESFAGTPAYMAPEQIDGAEATEQSDIYSLGLCLYELFTGERLFSGTPAEIAVAHGVPKRRPSSAVRGLSPAVERVILHCIEESPGERPESVRDVLAELPGGDALRAAIESGQTPSPREVAAAAGAGGMPLATAWAVLVATLLLIGSIVWFSQYTKLYRQIPFAKSPDVLQERAVDVIRAAGYEPAETAYHERWMEKELEILREAAAVRSPAMRKVILTEGAPLRFGFRASPRQLVPLGRGATVTATDPPLDVSGMTLVLLDPRGSLTRFVRVPSAEPQVRSVAPVDWAPLFELAGLPQERFTPAAADWVSPVDADSKRSWIGTVGGEPGLRLNVRAASLQGRPVFFSAELARSHVRAPAPSATATEQFVGVTGFAVVFVGTLTVAILVARRNLRLNRGDRPGARKISLLVFFASFLAGLLSADHSTSVESEWGILVGSVGYALFSGATLWLFYIAAEPYVRRRQPELLISWNRLLRGYFRDPLVARDVLLGCLLGAILHLFYTQLLVLLPPLLGIPPALPDHGDVAGKLLGGMWPVVMFASLLGTAPLYTVTSLFIFSAVRSISRSDWLAMLVLLPLAATPYIGRDLGSAAVIPFTVAATAVFVYALCRISLLAGTVTLFFGSWLQVSIFVLDSRSWLFMQSLVYLGVTLGIVFYGFRLSLGATPLLGRVRLAD